MHDKPLSSADIDRIKELAQNDMTAEEIAAQYRTDSWVIKTILRLQA